MASSPAGQYVQLLLMHISPTREIFRQRNIGARPISDKHRGMKVLSTLSRDELLISYVHSNSQHIVNKCASALLDRRRSNRSSSPSEQVSQMHHMWVYNHRRKMEVSHSA
mmetsp:Transcript_29589/g.71211  ORF Transcript_29589/g.71211 Transcript_29589/m.71211 type:complete len:110 (-) Transcript_29589:707-1036(-)